MGSQIWDTGEFIYLNVAFCKRSTQFLSNSYRNSKNNKRFDISAGQEKFRAMTPMYYRNANAALLVFDLTNYNSFVEVKGWVQELHK